MISTQRDYISVRKAGKRARSYMADVAAMRANERLRFHSESDFRRALNMSERLPRLLSVHVLFLSFARAVIGCSLSVMIPSSTGILAGDTRVCGPSTGAVALAAGVASGE